MKKNIYSLLFLSLSFSLLHSQNLPSKLDGRLQHRLMKGDIRNANIELLVRGDMEQIKLLTEKLQGTYKYGYNRISSISISEKNALAFSVDPAVEKIENTGAKGVFLMDSARIKNNIDSAQAGYAPLTSGLSGSGVIVGIIDGGIYWQHPDFKHPDGTTRIRYIWDQTISGANAPFPYNYGNQWSWVDINAGNCTEVEGYTGSCADYSHGTCVAGIASGNDRSDSANSHLAGKYTGVAPESDLIVVSIGAGTCVDQTNFESHVADAVDYIFKKASALGMPCVINTSVGTYYGSHDGNDLTTHLIEALLEQSNGRCLVAAAGNGGSIPHHISYSVPADSAYTFFNYNPNGVYYDFWADTASFNHASFAIGCADKYGNKLYQTEYFNMTTNLIATVAGAHVNRSAFFGSTTLGTIDIYSTLDSGRYHVEAVITPDSTFYLWSLQTTGSGTLDLWASSGLIGTSDIVDSLPTLGGGNVYISDTHYHHGDLNKTIVSSWQCSDKVITVGNYSNRAGYLDYDSNYFDLTLPANGGEIVGKRFYTSSFGPTRDNRLKPDIMATGSTTLATGDLNDIALKLGGGLHYKVALGGKHERNGGTSMSSPLVAGIAALYFQKRPTATYNEIKQALICTAVKDNFTGATANNEYGNGKVNAFDALTSSTCITYGATDTACLNYNATANVDTGGCVAKIYGCTDPSASNYDSAANVNNGGCLYVTNNLKTIGNSVSLKVSPNPFSDQTIFSFTNDGYNFEKAQVIIMNELGETADVFNLGKASGNYNYRNDKLAKGIYLYRLMLDQKIAKTGKLVVE